MEDAHIAVLDSTKDYSIFGVFDGHGGYEVSEFVRMHFADSFKQCITNSKTQNYEEVFKEVFHQMDEMLLSNEGKAEINEICNKVNKTQSSYLTKRSEDSINYVGCTACVGVITKDKIYVANAGDSRAVMYKGGHAIPLSIDHKPNLPAEKARIIKANGIVDENRVNGSLNLSRSIGDFEYKKNGNLKYNEQMVISLPEVHTEEITPDVEYVIIACDGVWDVLSNDSACSLVSDKIRALDKKAKLSKVLEQVMEKIIATDVSNSEGIGCDNMTAILIRFKK